MGSILGGNISFFGGHEGIVASGSFLKLLIVPTAGKSVQAFFSGKSTLEGELKLYEAATASADGTIISLFDFNRVLKRTASPVLTHTPTVTGTGTLLASVSLKVGRNNVGGSFESDEPVILDPAVKYLLEAKSLAAGNVIDLNVIIKP